MNTTNLDSIMNTIEQIPTLPIVSQQIMSVLGDEEGSVRRVADLIEKDQALAVKILKVANSAFYGTLGKVRTIDHALVILGLKEVKAILLAFSVYNFLSVDEYDGFDRSNFWKHAIICSHVAKYLARHFDIMQGETVFLSGLIHDMGKVVFDKYFHEEFMQVLHYVSSNNESFSQAEKEILGVTHYQVGAKLLQKWNFPQEVIMNVFYHHAPWHDINYLSGSIVTCLANIFTKLAGYPCLPGEKEVEIAQLANSKLMDFIVKSGFDLDDEEIKKLRSQIRAIISQEGPNILCFFEN